MAHDCPTISYLAESIPPSSSLYPGPPLKRPLRFLVVDDSRSVRSLIRGELEPIGAVVKEAGCGMEAIELCQSFRPDAMTLDVVMPDLDGYAVCERIKSDELTMSIPVVIVASRPTEQERVRAFLAGAVEYFTKPFPRGSLRRFMEHLIARIRAHRHQRVNIALASTVDAVHTESVLRAHGYDCGTIRDPKAAVDSLSEGCSLLVLDLDFPDDKSFEALLSVRDRASVERLPIVAVTADEERLRMAVAFNAGAGDVLRRPIFPEELVARVENQLQLVELEKRLVEEATVDPLTGLFNRRHLGRTVTVELKRAARHGEPLGILIADLDHFKQINDTHGHGVGDEVLKACAKEMSQHIRATDVVARYGGEEFVFLMPGDREMGLRVVADRIRMHIEALRIPTTHGLLSVTVSFGGTWWEPESSNLRLDFQQLLQPADQALYMAKAEGRNRCVMVTSSGRRRSEPRSGTLEGR